MQAPTLETSEEALAPAVRRRIIQRSLRCLTFAWIGLIPIAGAAMAILTIRLHRQALSEAGETFLHRPLVVMFCVGAPFATVIGYHFGFDAGLAMNALFIALQINYIQRQFRTHEIVPPVNPVRHQAFLGLKLAYTGLFLGASLAGSIICSMLREL